jgi:hypothetical protein
MWFSGRTIARRCRQNYAGGIEEVQEKRSPAASSVAYYMYIYIYIYVCVCVCVCVHIYIVIVIVATALRYKYSFISKGVYISALCFLPNLFILHFT